MGVFHPLLPPKSHKIHQLKKQGDDTAILEEEIDNMVFQLYDFTSDEIDLIRSASL